MVLKWGAQVYSIVISVSLTQGYHSFSLVMRVILSVSPCLSMFLCYFSDKYQGNRFPVLLESESLWKTLCKEAVLLRSQEECIAGNLTGKATTVNAIDGLCTCKNHSSTNCNSVFLNVSCIWWGKMMIYRQGGMCLKQVYVCLMCHGRRWSLRMANSTRKC